MWMVLDASPWALGGILVIGGIPVAIFHSPLSTEDETIHGFQRGDHRGQQCWECLTVLVAITAWYNQWRTRRLTVCIKSESKSALALAERLKAGPSAKIIAQELALIYHWASFEPKIEHVPGVANQLADALSRMNDPNKPKGLPQILKSIPFTTIPIRYRSYYWTLAA